MTKTYLLALADYNIWANDKLINWLSQISLEQFEQPLVGSFQNIHETNVLKIMKFDDNIDKQLYFLINDQMIFQTKYLPMFGFETGFIAFQNMKIGINFFKATFYFDENLIKQ